MKILMIGGTAFFGKDIVRCLGDAGHEVTVFTRGNVKPDELKRFKHIDGDRHNAADLQRAEKSEKWDVVIDNIAYDAKTVQAALSIFKKVKRYVLTSTISVFRFSPPNTQQPLLEDVVDFDMLPVEETNDIHWSYARGKLEAERTLVRQDSVPWTIIRPPIVYGPSDISNRGFWYLARLLKGGPIILPNGGQGSTRLGYSEDVAALYLPAIERSISIGRIYNVAHQEIITLRDFIDQSASFLGCKPEYVSLPFPLCGELGGPYAMERNWIPDITAAQRDLGFIPTPWLKVASKTACWFRDCWEGDEAALMKTRPEELALASQWAKATSTVRSPVR